MHLYWMCNSLLSKIIILTLLHSERPKLHKVLAVLSAVRLNELKFKVLEISEVSKSTLLLCDEINKQLIRLHVFEALF